MMSWGGDEVMSWTGGSSPKHVRYRMEELEAKCTIIVPPVTTTGL
jgi:hypothetical protein